MTKLRLVCATAALAATVGGTVLAETTANVGMASDYIFRGSYQSGASAFAGIDVEADNGFYLGLWGSDLDDGFEYDIYTGYARSGDMFDWYAGLTGYYFTDEFDETAEEFNAGFTFGFMSIDYALGDYKIDGWQCEGEGQTYTYVGATFAPMRGPYYFIGRTDYSNVNRANPLLPSSTYQGNWSGTGSQGVWVEIGKSFEVMEDLEVNIAALYSGDVTQVNSTTPSSVQLGPDCSDIGCTSHESEFALVFTLTKTIRTNF